MRGIGSPKETITPAGLEDLPWELSDEDIADRATVTYTPTVIEQVSNNSLHVWESSELLEIPANGTISLEQTLEAAVANLAPWRSYWDDSAPKDQYSRWTGGFTKDAGVDIPPLNALTVTSVLLSATRVRITVTNNTSQTFYVAWGGEVGLELRANKRATLGAPVTLETGASEETARNTASLDVGPFVASEAKARELLGWLAQQAAVPRKTLTQVTVVPDPARRLGDLILVKEPSTGVDSRVLITGISTSMGLGGLSQSLTLTLVDGVVPSPPPVGVKITDPIGTSNSATLAERQAIRDAKAATTDLTDTTPPPAPSAPVLSARLGVISISYDGLTNTGGSMPSRVERIEVGFGDSSEPTAIVDTIAAAGGLSLIGDQPYQEQRYVRLRAVTYSGVAGPWGDERSIAVTPLVNTDLIGAVIEEANLGDNTVSARTIIAGAVISEKIAALAVTAGKIAANAVTADKILAGAITAIKIDADAVTGEKIAATAIDGKTITGAILRTAASGQRVQIDSAGLRAFNSSNTVVTTISASTGALTATGATLTGTLTTTSGSETTTIGNGRVTVGTGNDALVLDSVGIRFAGTQSAAPSITANPDVFNSSMQLYASTVNIGRVSSTSLPDTAQVNVAATQSFYVRRAGAEMIGVFADGTSELVRFPQSYSRTYGTQTSSGGTRFAVITSAGTLGTLTGAAAVPGNFTAGRVFSDGILNSPGSYSNTGTTSANLYITSAGNILRSTSLRSAKDAIEDLDIDGLEVTRALRPRTWHDKGSMERLAAALAREAGGEEVDWAEVDVEMGRIPGFVAEEIADLDLPAGFATRDTDGNLTGVAYDRIPAIHTIAIQQMANQIDSLIERINQLEGAA
jgi:hypothetical protein